MRNKGQLKRYESYNYHHDEKFSFFSIFFSKVVSPDLPECDENNVLGDFPLVVKKSFTKYHIRLTAQFEAQTIFDTDDRSVCARRY